MHSTPPTVASRQHHIPFLARLAKVFAPTPEHAAKLKKDQDIFEALPPDTFKSLKNYWPYYLSQHSQPGTRAMHFAGITAGTLLAGLGVTGAALSSPAWAWLLPLAPVLALASARLSHQVIEHNAPAQPPSMALLGDVYMVGQMLRGRLWKGDPNADGEAALTAPRG